MSYRAHSRYYYARRYGLRRSNRALTAAGAAILAIGAGGSAAARHHGGGSSWNGRAPASATAWAHDVLSAGHWPQTRANVASLTTWAAREAQWNAVPPDGAVYTRNPLNMTQAPGENASVPGTPGVSVLPDWRTGINDTADRINGGLYPQLAASLRAGAGLCGYSRDFLTWSGNSYSSVC